MLPNIAVVVNTPNPYLFGNRRGELMGLGVRFPGLVAPFMEDIAPYLPGETFPFFFTVAMFQRALLAA